MQVRNAVWLPWLPQFQWYDGIKSRKSELHAVWLIVSMTTTDWKEKKKEEKKAILRHLQEVVVKMLKNIFVTPPGGFFSPSFFLFYWAYTAMGLHSECDYGRAVSSLGEAREDDRGCLLKTAPFSCLSLINMQFSVILYKNIIHTLWYTLKTFWILAVNYLANYQPGYPVFCV